MSYGENSKAKAQTKEYDNKYPKIDWSNSPHNMKKDKEECKTKKCLKSLK